MKRGLILVLIFCMCISFVSFGEEITDLVVYKDKEAGYTYFFGKFSDDLKGSEDIGFEIDGKYFSLNNQDVNDPSKTAFEVACEKQSNDGYYPFGIGIKNLSKAFGSEFNVTPYTKNDNKIKLMENSLSYTTYNKNPEMVAAYHIEKLKPGYYDPESSSMSIVSDYTHELVTVKDAEKVYCSEELLLKYDISDFDGTSENNKVILKINVIAKESETSSKDGKIKVLTVKSEDYSKEKGYYHDTNLSIISEKTIKTTHNSIKQDEFEEFTFDVTNIVNAKIKNNENSVTFVIQLNDDKVRNRAYVSLYKNSPPELTIE